MNTTFTHIILSSRCTVSNVFCFFDYLKLFFCCERAITRSCSHSLLNMWFALHSLTRVGIILFGGGAVPTLFQIMRAHQFFFAKLRKKYARNIRVYTVVFGETSESDIPLEHGLQARKHFIEHNSEAGHETLKNYISWTLSIHRGQAGKHQKLDVNGGLS